MPSGSRLKRTPGPEQAQRDEDGCDLEPRYAQRPQFDAAAELRQERQTDGPRAENEHDDVLQEIDTAKEVINKVAGFARRSGRKAMRSINKANTTATASAAPIRTAGGWPSNT